MIKVNGKLPSFKEFYLIEEGIGSSIIEKFNELKREIMTKDLYGNPINTKKIRSLEEEIVELLKALGRLNKEVFKRFADMILQQVNYKMGKTGIRLGFLLTAIAHLLAIYSAKSVFDTKENRYKVQGLSSEYEKSK